MSAAAGIRGRSHPRSRGPCSPLTPLLPLRRLERRLEVQRSLVERTAGDGSGYTVGFEGSQFFDVLQAADAATGDDRDFELAGELDGGVNVHPGQHAVAPDVGIDHRFDAVVFELARKIDNVVSGQLRPPVGGNLALARVQTDDDVSGK